MKHRTTRALYDYWHRRRGGRAAPSRAEIEPSDIHALLADTFVLECDRPRRMPFRLAGTRVCLLFNRELKGTDFYGLWRPRDREAIAAAMSAMRQEAAGHVIAWRGCTETDHEVAGELVALPLTMGGARIARVLGAMVPFELPVWLGAVPLTTLELRAVHRLDTDGGQTTVSMPPEPMAADADSHAGARKVGHLSVYAGGLDAE
jgi:hypothetical protein